MGLPNSWYVMTRETQTSTIKVMNTLNVIVLSRRLIFFSSSLRLFFERTQVVVRSKYMFFSQISVVCCPIQQNSKVAQAKLL
jgi:hypothetical protein